MINSRIWIRPMPLRFTSLSLSLSLSFSFSFLWRSAISANCDLNDADVSNWIYSGLLRGT
jgi:hypothetical protein